MASVHARRPNPVSDARDGHLQIKENIEVTSVRYLDVVTAACSMQQAMSTDSLMRYFKSADTFYFVVARNILRKVINLAEEAHRGRVLAVDHGTCSSTFFIGVYARLTPV
ncbi:hypothetical protein OH76DRAFT_1408773 [Lentinus brumalis]|uniref:Uncharacterized protein n=1 Tax=Lentinus brumalis TaxID=2498619 RepID=A0A371CWP3_9APHY|nr:hypothetical protein OH76DRAFT_1408773 [Polyporus brumalis]